MASGTRSPRGRGHVPRLTSVPCRFPDSLLWRPGSPAAGRTRRDAPCPARTSKGRAIGRAAPCGNGGHPRRKRRPRRGSSFLIHRRISVDACAAAASRQPFASGGESSADRRTHRFARRGFDAKSIVNRPRTNRVRQPRRRPAATRLRRPSCGYRVRALPLRYRYATFRSSRPRRRRRHALRRKPSRKGRSRQIDVAPFIAQMKFAGQSDPTQFVNCVPRARRPTQRTHHHSSNHGTGAALRCVERFSVTRHAADTVSVAVVKRSGTNRA